MVTQEVLGCGKLHYRPATLHRWDVVHIATCPNGADYSTAYTLFEIEGSGSFCREEENESSKVDFFNILTDL